jgi:hypothetical protein
MTAAQDAYLRDLGERCPRCSSMLMTRNYLSMGHITTDHPPRLPRVTVDCRCTACGGRWVEWYELNAISGEGIG